MDLVEDRAVRELREERVGVAQREVPDRRILERSVRHRRERGPAESALPGLSRTGQGDRAKTAGGSLQARFEATQDHDHQEDTPPLTISKSDFEVVRSRSPAF